MSWTLIHLSDIPPAAWRNGGGSTRELLAWPDARDWLWRLSVAEITHDGPFSTFAGVQRWFAVLAGAGVRLNVGGRMHSLTCASPPHRFDGGMPADCETIDGSTQDFNLMVRGGNAHVERVAGSHAGTIGATDLVACYAHGHSATAGFKDDSIELPPQSLAWRIAGSGGSLRLSGRDALWMRAEQPA